MHGIALYGDPFVQPGGKRMKETRTGMQDLKPTVWIGKQGCTDATIREIRDQVKKRKLIKVKWLQSTEIDPEALATATGSRLIEVRGRTVVLSDRKQKER